MRISSRCNRVAGDRSGFVPLRFTCCVEGIFRVQPMYAAGGRGRRPCLARSASSMRTPGQALDPRPSSSGMETPKQICKRFLGERRARRRSAVGWMAADGYNESADVGDLGLEQITDGAGGLGAFE